MYWKPVLLLTLFVSVTFLSFISVSYALPFVATMRSTAGKPRLVGAYYYVWYSGASDNPRFFHWNDTRENMVKLNPTLGRYSSLDSDVVQHHIGWIKSASIDFVIVSWWGKGRYEDRAAQKFVHVLNQMGNPIQFCIMIECYPSVIGDYQSFISQVIYVVEKYAGNSAYLKLDGKPVLVAYNVNPEWMRQLRGTMVGRGLSLFMSGTSFRDWVVEYIEGFMPYGPAASIRELADYCRNINLRLPYGVFMVSPGYDESQLGRSKSLVIPRDNGVHYQEAWDFALENHPNIVVIVSFNEWHEETSIEPCSKWGDLYLKLTYENAMKFHMQ